MKQFLLFISIFVYSLWAHSQVQSTLEIYDLEKHTRTLVLQEELHFEAPNWSPDSKELIVNSEGKLYKINIATKIKSEVNTGSADKINNDHGISSDGSQIVISNSEGGDWRASTIYVLPYSGGTPRLVTSKTPSFWHGWSPDGEKLAYVGLRNQQFNIYTIAVEGGEEEKLTSSTSHVDGPDYSSDGKYIYYNSLESGNMEIWRMLTDGTEQVKLTEDEYSNWFPHPSPNGDVIVYLSYLENQGSDHPAMKEVALRLYDIKEKTSQTLCKFTGGQGTINVPSWSPDGKKFAFVSYQYVENDK